MHMHETAFDSFVAGTLPMMLEPLLHQLQTLHTGVVRLGMFMTSSDGTVLRHWADSDGQVLVCPEELRLASDNPALEQLRADAMRAAQVGTERALWWACEGVAVPVVALAVRRRGDVLGYLVIAADPRRPLNTSTVSELLAWGPIVAELVAHSIESTLRLVSGVRFATQFTHARDPLTGEHQLRMGSFLNVLANEMAPSHGLSDSFVEELTLFGSLHDVGKIGVPDNILLKPGRFDATEWSVMKTHVEKGSALIARMVEDLHLEDVPAVDTLKAVVGCHHEYLDGSGYPEGRQGDEISMAARMVTTADIFDALTHSRPYKRGWNVDEALDHLDSLAGVQLDRDCVEALRSAKRKVEQTLRDLQQGNDSGAGQAS